MATANQPMPVHVPVLAPPAKDASKSSKWLADTKKFNAHRIRRRMKEQQERFGSKGKAVSSSPPLKKVFTSPLRKGGPTLTLQETEMDENSSPNPALVIAVTMSEDGEDPVESKSQGPNFSIHEDLQQIGAENDESTAANVSAWAMMEHYQLAKDDGPKKNATQQIHQTTEQGKDSAWWDSSQNYSFESSDSNVLREMTEQNRFTPTQEIFVPPTEDWDDHEASESASCSRKQYDTPDRIGWHADDNGELVQNSYYTYESECQSGQKIPADDSVDTPNGTMVECRNQEDGPEYDGNSGAQEDSQQSNYSIDHDDRFPNAFVVSAQAQPTPARLRKKWQDEKERGEDTSLPMSLLQESMIQSDYHPNEGSATDELYPRDEDNELEDFINAPEESYSVDSFASHAENVTQLSILSLQPSDAGMLGIASQETTKALFLVRSEASSDPALPNERPDSKNKENFAYLARIEELEQNLKEQRHNTDHVQSKMKERVVELEQVLRATAATPRGTIIQENPLKTLLDRNQTLVKEVRFADQTCVELSSNVSALEAKNRILKEQMATLERENGGLRQESEEKEESYLHDLTEKQETIDRLSEDLMRAQKTPTDEQTLRIVLDELKKEVGALEQQSGEPLVSSASSLLSQMDSFTANASDGTGEIDMSYTSYCLAKALQKQVQLLKEKTTIDDRSQDLLQQPQEPLSLELQADKLPLEMSMAQAENDFLGRQLGNAQDKLDRTRKDLEEEHSRSRALEQNWKEEAEAQLRKIESLEDQLDKATEHMYLYKDGPTSPRLLDADKRVFALEKELAHAKANIVAMKRESEKILSSATQGDDEVIMKEDKETIATLQAALSRMHDHYKQLDHQAKNVVESYTERLVILAETVSYLRSSLLFETESVSTQVQEETAQRMMNATIDSHRSSHQEDEMLELMEEARSPPLMKYPHVDEASSDFEDVSRLFSDDVTLESIVKGGSVGSSFSHAERWKEPLEAAMKECLRVKDRSSKLKEEVEAHKAAIGSLEVENGRLCLNASRKTEENDLVEKALQEAKERIEELHSLLDSTKQERDQSQQVERKRDEDVKMVEQERNDLQDQLRDAHEKHENLERRLEEVNDALKESNSTLQLAKKSCDEYERRCHDLLSELQSKEAEISGRKDEEILLIRQALRQAEKDVDEMRQSNRDIISKLAFESNEKSKHESMVADLQASQQRLFSDAEDRVLESRYKLEDMRKERAELRSKLSRKEKEIASMKDVFAGFKSKIQAQLDQKDSVIRSFQSERSEVAFQTEQLVSVRHELFEVLESVGFCSDVVQRISIAEEDLSVDDGTYKCVRELSYWRDIIPSMGKSIQLICQRQRKVNHLEQEAEGLQEDLFRLKGVESDYKKQVEDEKVQNEKLFTLLRQAELEMERSAKQIREMSAALSRLQQQEVAANEKAKAFESECTQIQEELVKVHQKMEEERSHAQLRLSEVTAALRNKESQLSEASEQLSSVQSNLGRTSESLRSKEADESRLRSAVDSLETKCSRLRDYIKKLTVKCEEWEVSYEQQAKSIEKLQGKNVRIRERASEIANRYRKLAGDVQRKRKSHTEDRAKWTAERSNLHQVHTQLEEELEIIARELSTVDHTISSK